MAAAPIGGPVNAPSRSCSHGCEGPPGWCCLGWCSSGHRDGCANPDRAAVLCRSCFEAQRSCPACAESVCKACDRESQDWAKPPDEPQGETRGVWFLQLWFASGPHDSATDWTDVFVGPFETPQDAAAWSAAHKRDFQGWKLRELQSPVRWSVPRGVPGLL